MAFNQISVRATRRTIEVIEILRHGVFGFGGRVWCAADILLGGAFVLYLVFCLAGLTDTTGTRQLVFRPMDPPITVPAYLVTKKYQNSSPAVRLFLERIRTRVEHKDERA